MINSIRYFEENSIKRFEELENNFMKNPTRMAEYIVGIAEEGNRFLLKMIQETLESMNQMIIGSPLRKRHWDIECHSSKQLTTSIGDVTFTKTLFVNKETGKSEYLLDRILELEKHERMTEDAVTKMLLETVQTSYRRGGEECSELSGVSKQTVKNKLHQLQFPQMEKCKAEKKSVDYLYIEADEDHVSLQFREKKGDLKENENHQKNNCLITKLVYVHEGIENESPKSKRHKLVNPYYFCRVCSGKENEKFWDEVYEYIADYYDLSTVKKIYVSGDGGAWIKAGMKRIAGITYVLDEFHLEKYLTKLTSHMLDSRDDAKEELRKIIRFKKKDDFSKKADELKGYLKDDTGLKRMNEAEEYILSNWMAARARLLHKDGVKGCSAEGHVSHILSARMSSRPMGWSIKGASVMAQLRAYYLNGGNVLELVRYQKKELPKASGSEYEVLSGADIMVSETKRHGELGKYLETISHHISKENKKQIFFQAHLWNL